MPQYKDLALTIIASINDGSIAPGDKLLSVRTLSLQHNVSITTVLNCYGYMQERGYAATRPRSGYFAQKPSITLKEAPLLVFNGTTTTPTEFAIKRNTHAFSTAQLAPTLLPEKAMARSVTKAMKVNVFGSLGYAGCLAYGESNGLLPLRTALSAHYAQHGFAFKREELVIGHGCLDSVRVALEVTTKPGDTIVVASPCFSGLLDLLRLTKRHILEIPSAKNGIDLHQLEDIVQQKRAAALLLTASFQNPLGHNFSNGHKKDIARIANKYDFPVIEDDVYQELSFSGLTPLPIKHWDENGDVLWCSSFSKTLCASFRVGWCLPGKYLQAFKKRRRVESLGVNSPLQLALADFIATGSYHKHLKKVRDKLQPQLRQYRQILAQMLGEQIAISNPQGGMVLWCYIRGIDSRKLADTLYQKNIGIRPGRLFSTRDFYDEFFRINCGWPLDDKRSNELKTLCECIKEMV